MEPVACTAIAVALLSCAGDLHAGAGARLASAQTVERAAVEGPGPARASTDPGAVEAGNRPDGARYFGQSRSVRAAGASRPRPATRTPGH